ncbi:MAG: methytransferase partner Trm112, partial [Planctomycetes bacterium]|nr:methytransferase partner Trm112 [Planctomycetota bacterium]
MKRDLMDILACPVCKGELTLSVAKEEGDEVVEGTLHCDACSEDYPIEDTIPNLLPPDLRKAVAADADEPGEKAAQEAARRTRLRLIEAYPAAATALEAGTIRPDTLLFCEEGLFPYYDSTIHDTSPHGWLTLERAIRVSSNICAAKAGLSVPVGLFHETITRFGFGRRPGLFTAPSGRRLAGEAEGYVLPPNKWTPVDHAAISFGHGILVSPLQLIMAVNAIATGGLLLKPILVKEIRDAEGRLLQRNQRQVVRRVISRQTAATVRDFMEGVVSEGGTGYRAALAGYLRDEGMAIRGGVGYREIRRTADGVALTLDDGERLAAEAVLVATGRRPNTDGLGLADAGVALSHEGGIEVDDRMRTSKPGVYAAGDVTGRDKFVYMAAYGAKIAAENALDGDARRYDAGAMPLVVFTDPQVASVGLTEAAAREQGLEVRTSVLPLEMLPRALAARDTRGLIKLVAETGTDRLLGAHLLAPEGGDSIQAAALAIKAGMTVGELADTIFPYLTTVEGLKLAAQGFEREIE